MIIIWCKLVREFDCGHAEIRKQRALQNTYAYSNSKKQIITMIILTKINATHAWRGGHSESRS